ncbi:ATP-binding protein [Actinomadura citrea]|uniref:ATP-binding protein n=1 Tax=Actinomadura citrea TaxID=46158 RepID=UPI003CE49ADF
MLAALLPWRARAGRNIRRFAGCLLAGCPFLDDVLLAADELVVNALRHTKSGQMGGSFTVEVVRDGGLVAVSVTPANTPATEKGANSSIWPQKTALRC